MATNTDYIRDIEFDKKRYYIHNNNILFRVTFPPTYKHYMMAKIQKKFVTVGNVNFLTSRQMKLKPDLSDMAKDMAYERNHPFFEDWTDWKDIVYNYYSTYTIETMREIYSRIYLMQGGIVPYDNQTTPHLRLMHSISSYSQYVRDTIRTLRLTERPWQSFKEIFDGDRIMASSTLKCDCVALGRPVECPFYKEHLQAKYIAALHVIHEYHMWNEHLSRPLEAKRCAIYTSCMCRLVLSLPLRRLKQLTMDFLMDPRKYMIRRRSKMSFVKYIYSRAFLEDYSSDQMAHSITMMTRLFKGMIPVEQSGVVTQCNNDPSAFFSEEFYQTATCVLDKIPIEFFCFPKEQGFWSFKHEHKIDTEGLNHVKAMITETQTDFFNAFKTTAITSAKEITCIFAAGATAALITKHMIGMGFSLLQKILQLIYSMIFPDLQRSTRNNMAIEQGPNGISVPLLPAAITEYVIQPPKNVLSRLWHNPQIDTTMRRIGYLGDLKIERGLYRIVDTVHEMINRVYAWFCSEVFGVENPEDLRSSSHVVDQWLGEVDELVDRYYDGTLVWTQTSYSVVKNLYSRGIQLTRSPAYEKWIRHIWKLVQQLGSLLEKFKHHNKDGYSARDPPVVIYLSGGSGVGKSSITYPLAVEILKGIFEKEGNTYDLKNTWKNFIYMRSPEQEYWDGYADQLVTVFDDFNQQADSASNPSLELFEIIRAANVFPYPLHMANLDDKATTSFNSRIIIVSSNMDKPRSQSLNFPEALLNRLSLSVRVTRQEGKEGYKGPFDPSIYKMETYDIKTQQKLEDITYKELVNKAIEQYSTQNLFVKSMDDYIQSLFPEDAPVEQAGEIEALIEDYENITNENIRQRHDQATNPFNERLNRSGKQEGERLQRVIEYLRWRNPEGPPVIDDYLDSYDIGEEYRQHLIEKQPWILRPLYRFKRWMNNTPLIPESEMDRLAVTTYAMRHYRREIRTTWQKFQTEHPYIFKAIKVGAFLGVGFAFVKLFAKILGNDKTKMVTEEGFIQGIRERTPRSMKTQAESYSVGAPKVAKVESYSPVQPKVAKTESLTLSEGNYPKGTLTENLIIEQGVKDLNAAEILAAIVRSNLYKMYESTCDAPLGHALFLRGKICLMPKHYLRQMKVSLANDPNAVIYFRSALLGRAFEIPLKTMLATKLDYDSPDEGVTMPFTKDLMTVIVDSAIVHKDALPYFATRESLSRVNTTEVCLPVAVNNPYGDSKTDILLLRYRKAASSMSKVPVLPVHNTTGVATRRIRDAWRYEADTEPTECGAPLIARNTMIRPGKICGIHIAGIQGTGEGFAVPLYYDDIEKILALREDKLTQELRREYTVASLSVVEQGGSQIPSTATFIRLGKIHKPVGQPTKTKIRPSLVHGMIQTPKTKPCQLRDTEEFSPRQYRLNRLGNVPRAIDTDIAVTARKALVDNISKVFQRRRNEIGIEYLPVYSFEQAVTGIPGSNYVTSIKRKTSPGFPFIQQDGWRTRWEIFGDGDEFDLSTPQVKKLMDRCNYIIEKANQGIALDHCFIDTLKDERKPIHKAHKTRLFSAGPLDYLICCKQYFNGSVALFQTCRNWDGVSVGVNPYSADWSEIVKVLHQKSRHIVAGDFEGFDASQHRVILEQAGEVFVQIAKEFLGADDETVKVMRVLLVSLLDSIHVCGDDLYQWTHSLPSGHYLTAPINSVFVLLAFCIMWMYFRNDFSYLTAREFFDECGLVAYGDDHLLSIPEKYLDGFSQLTIPDYAKRIGLSYTMEDKDAVATRPSRKIEEVNYLRRSFVRDETGQWLAPLDLDVILETPMWMHITPDAEAQTIENLEWGLKELSLHREEVWKQWSPRFFGLMEKLGHYTVWKTQDSARSACLAQTLEM